MMKSSFLVILALTLSFVACSFDESFLDNYGMDQSALKSVSVLVDCQDLVVSSFSETDYFSSPSNKHLVYSPPSGSRFQPYSTTINYVSNDSVIEDLRKEIKAREEEEARFREKMMAAARKEQERLRLLKEEQTKAKWDAINREKEAKAQEEARKQAVQEKLNAKMKMRQIVDDHHSKIFLELPKGSERLRIVQAYTMRREKYIQETVDYYIDCQKKAHYRGIYEKIQEFMIKNMPWHPLTDESSAYDRFPEERAILNTKLKQLRALQYSRSKPVDFEGMIVDKEMVMIQKEIQTALERAFEGLKEEQEAEVMMVGIGLAELKKWIMEKDLEDGQ